LDCWGRKEWQRARTRTEDIFQDSHTNRGRVCDSEPINVELKQKISQTNWEKRSIEGKTTPGKKIDPDAMDTYFFRGRNFLRERMGLLEIEGPYRGEERWARNTNPRVPQPEKKKRKIPDNSPTNKRREKKERRSGSGWGYIFNSTLTSIRGS